jgi:hypothetical protein
MKGFLKGFFIGMILLFVGNFFFEFMDKCTYSSAKSYVNAKLGNEEVSDTLAEADINLNIAKELQKNYGADSLIVTSISKPSKQYEYYVSGVKGVKDLDDVSHRVKNVEFNKGNLAYKVIVIYNSVDGAIVRIENDNTPAKVVEVQPIKPTAQPSVQSPTVTPIAPVQKDTTTANNQNIGTPTNVGDYNNNSDV